MSGSGPFDSSDSRAPVKKLESAMTEIAEYRRRLMQAIQAGRADDRQLLREFHAALMNYYYEVQQYSDWSVLEGKWENARLWRREEDWGHGGVVMVPGRDYKTHHDEATLTQTGEERLADTEWVRGVDTLATWIGRTRTVKRDTPGLGGGTEPVREPVHLPPDKLIRGSVVLDRMVRELGIGIDENSGPRPAVIMGDAPEDNPTVDEIQGNS